MVSDCHGRTRTLVSQGAVDFALKHGPSDGVVPPENMISESARQTWKKWKDRLESSAPAITQAPDTENLLQDTVGAVSWHSRSGFTAGVSSGGILLKLPGRIGEVIADILPCIGLLSDLD